MRPPVALGELRTPSCPGGLDAKKMNGEEIEKSIEVLKRVPEQLLGTAAVVRTFADSLSDADGISEETRTSLHGQGEAMATALDAAADAMAVAWQQMKRASNAVWANTPRTEVKGADHGL
jgi:hypothetical protein